MLVNSTLPAGLNNGNVVTYGPTSAPTQPNQFLANVDTTTGDTQFLTAAGAKASLGLATVATTGDYADLINTPILGSAAAKNITFFLQTANNLSDVNATAAKTNLGLATVASTGSYNDLSNKLTNGTGLTLTGNQFSITNTITAGSVGGATGVPVLTYNAQGQLTATSTALLTSVGTITVGTWTANKIGLAYGGTNADLSGTGGTHQVLCQSSAGAAITVRQLANTDITGFGTISTQNSDNVTITGGSITGLSAAVNPSDVTILSQVQSLVATGVRQFREVDAVFFSNVVITAPGTLTDGTYTVTTGARILLTGQTATSQNGPWVYGTTLTALTRPSEYASGSSQSAGLVYLIEQAGSAKAGYQYILNTNNVTVDTTGTSWGVFSGPYTGSNGVTVSGQVISLTNNAITIAGTSTALGSSISQDTITGLSTTGLVKRTGANTLATATAGTDFAAPTSGTSLLYGDNAGGFSNATVSSSLSFLAGALAIAASAAYTILGNSTNASAVPTANQVVVLGTPGYTPSGSSPVNITTTANSYAQMQIQNLSNGSSASSDFVVTANDGNDTTHYADFGINSSVGGTTPFGNAHAAYLYTVDAELNLAALGTNGVINLYTGNASGTQTQLAVFAVPGASTPSFLMTQTPYSAGTATTNFPLDYKNFGASGPTTWSTAGTVIGVNASSTFSGNVFDYHKNGGTSLFLISSAGAVTASGTIASGNNVQAANQFAFAGSTLLSAAAGNGLLTLSNSAQTAFTRLIFGVATTSGVALTLDTATSLKVTLGDGTSTGAFTAGAITGTTLNVSAQATVGANSFYAFSGKARIYGNSSTDGVILLAPTAGPGNAFTQLQFGGTTSSFPSFTFSGTTITAKLADSSANCPFVASTLTGTLAGSNLASGTLGATVGFTVTEYNGGTIGSGATYTPVTTNGNMQYITNGAAFTLAPPAVGCTIIVYISNTTGAGAITTSGFTKVVGDSFDTTTTSVFCCTMISSTKGTVLNVIKVS